MPRISNIYEGSPGSLRAIIVMGAVLLTVLSGLFMVIGALLGVFVSGVAEKAPSPSSLLLIIAIVLLGLILVLLLVLLACSGCLGGKGRFPRELLALLPMLPMLPTILAKLSPALKATSVALEATSNSLAVVHGNLAAAGEAIALSDISIPVPTFSTKTYEVPNLLGGTTEILIFDSVDLTNTEDILSGTFSPLTGALDGLDASLDQFGTVVADLATASELLDDLADALPSTV